MHKRKWFYFTDSRVSVGAILSRRRIVGDHLWLYIGVSNCLLRFCAGLLQFANNIRLPILGSQVSHSNRPITVQMIDRLIPSAVITGRSPN